MERDEFIIEVYCLVCAMYQEFLDRYRSGRCLRGGGIAPALTDQEVITIELCGEYFKQHTDQDIFDYFMAHYRDFFPQLKERTAFVRQAAGLWQVKKFIQERLVQLAGADKMMSKSSILCRHRFARSRAVGGVTAALPAKRITATARLKSCIIMASNWDCASHAAA